MKQHFPSHHELIKIISIPIITQYNLLDRFMEFRKRYPNIDIEVSEQHTPPILRAIKNNEADVFILRAQHAPAGNDFSVNLLVQDDVSLVVSAKHHFADKEEISLTEAADENFLFLWYGTPTYTTFANVCHEAGFVPRTSSSHLSIDSILKMVSDGEGVTLIASKVAWYSKNDSLRVIRLKEKTELNTVAVTKRNSLTPVIENFINFIKIKS